MPPIARLFLSGSLKQHKIDGSGRPDENGRSDISVFDWFKAKIEQIGKSRIEVIVTRDPNNESISAEVRRDINRSDFMLCLFAKRCEDALLHQWTTSPYVIAESGVGAARFCHQTSQRPRMFAFIEEGVGRDQLGLAFPPDDRVLPIFRRDNLEACETKLREIVEKKILAESVEKRLFEPITLRKTVTILRSGWVWVETLYSHILHMDESGELRIPHTIWRVSRQLPSLRDMLSDGRSLNDASGAEKPMLRCKMLRCGNVPLAKLRSKIVERGVSLHGNEICFDLVFQGLNAEPCDALEYFLLSTYPNAFHDPADIANGHLNSAGMRTGQRGTVADATFILKFQRDWSENNDPRSIEEDPRCFVNGATGISASENPSEYWHDQRNWPEQSRMYRQDDSDAAYDVFIWNRSNFSGQLKATWQPGLNYHLRRPAQTSNVSMNTSIGTPNSD